MKTLKAMINVILLLIFMPIIVDVLILVVLVFTPVLKRDHVFNGVIPDIITGKTWAWRMFK